jgi:drug/metabolite transporter (DMT)-like permease
MLGVLLLLVVAVCYGISSTLQKYAVSSMKKFSFTRLFSNKRWLLSMLFGAAGTATYLIAMKIAPLFTVQIFMAISIVIPILAGFLFFKEKLKVMEWLCVGMILAGVFLTIL